MKKPGHREETANTHLAIALSKRGVQADAELILNSGKDRPDVLFQMRGLRVVIEGKFSDFPKARQAVSEDAKDRVRTGIAHIAAAVIYPEHLRKVATPEFAQALEGASLVFRIVTETGETDWIEGSPDQLLDSLRRAQDSLAKDDIVESTARLLSERLEGVAMLWRGQPVVCDRLSNVLGTPAPKGEKKQEADERRESAAKVSALVIANALIFQEQLSQSDERIEPLRKMLDEHDPVGRAGDHWQWIWRNINYVPIFQLGERVIAELPTNQNTIAAFRALLKEALEICRQQGALRHDLMGRIYHWLLHDAKYLGTYYTSTPAATLLLKLAFDADWGKMDFGVPSQLVSFKVADLACGTGTLLMATAQAVQDAFIRARADAGKKITPSDLKTLHRTLMENMLHGYDVLTPAIHLTASTLALLSPEADFKHMSLYVMPMGLVRGRPRLGSLDFLGSKSKKTQFALDLAETETTRVSATAAVESEATVPRMNLCVMNPPFVRSVGGNLLFGSLPEERAKLQTELKRRIKHLPASATAGLGAVFVALADEHLAVGGRLAFVLPVALVSGEAWAASRGLIAEHYHLETVITSHDAERPNFSENTDLSEVMFIARKRRAGEEPERTTYINLWRNPRTIHEALDLANRVGRAKPQGVEDQGTTFLRTENGPLCEMLTTPAPLGHENWSGALFSQMGLFRVAYWLERGEARIPGAEKHVALSFCRLDELGDLGYDRRDIHDAFIPSTDQWSPYPAFWDHKADKVLCIQQQANQFLIPRTEPAKGRPKKDAHQVWQRSGRVLLAERLWTITHRVLAVGFDSGVLGNTWWAFRHNLTTEQEKALLLWLNSSQSLLLFYARRVTTRSAWMQMKKPAWAAMPVLDVRRLDESQLAQLATAYDALCGQELQALCKLDADPVRKGIDDALSLSLKLPSLQSLRDWLAREPGLTGKGVAMNGEQEEMFDESGQEGLF